LLLLILQTFFCLFTKQSEETAVLSFSLQLVFTGGGTNGLGKESLMTGLQMELALKESLMENEEEEDDIQRAIKISLHQTPDNYQGPML
jgi:hypothetical protein